MNSLSGNLGDRILKQLEDMITSLGGTVPAKPRPFNIAERIVQLQDALRLVMGNGLVTATLNLRTTADCVSSYFFVANQPLRVVGVEYIHSVPEVTNASNVTVFICRNATNEAPDAGSFSTTFNAFNCRGAANVRQIGDIFGPFATLPQYTTLNPGDRLSTLWTNLAMTALARVSITVYMLPIRT
jgi:hypothetical protein